MSYCPTPLEQEKRPTYFPFKPMEIKSDKRITCIQLQNLELKPKAARVLEKKVQLKVSKAINMSILKAILPP